MCYGEEPIGVQDETVLEQIYNCYPFNKDDEVILVNLELDGESREELWELGILEEEL